VHLGYVKTKLASISTEFSSRPENSTLSECLDRRMPADAEAIGAVVNAISETLRRLDVPEQFLSQKPRSPQPGKTLTANQIQSTSAAGRECSMLILLNSPQIPQSTTVIGGINVPTNLHHPSAP
jgi:hypothetical protein